VLQVPEYLTKLEDALTEEKIAEIFATTFNLTDEHLKVTFESRRLLKPIEGLVRQYLTTFVNLVPFLGHILRAALSPGNWSTIKKFAAFDPIKPYLHYINKFTKLQWLYDLPIMTKRVMEANKDNYRLNLPIVGFEQEYSMPDVGFETMSGEDCYPVIMYKFLKPDEKEAQKDWLESHIRFEMLRQNMESPDFTDMGSPSEDDIIKYTHMFYKLKIMKVKIKTTRIIQKKENVKQRGTRNRNFSISNVTSLRGAYSGNSRKELKRHLGIGYSKETKKVSDESKEQEIKQLDGIQSDLKKKRGDYYYKTLNE